ncbi:hypothetical protein N7447_003190 [Penicillium robsamsonii]|uniref:uncharacterized protein n=1 Tax=Penicillium robsamsonii TaxID=1792511 RepID=UPI002548FDA1|nr:uncharacterized protein N7447_003190 [Penicillium robsamsonii]KAJ5837164.1 hypothetical protein N7447_003190 [Penicillium robsamsonii]
MLKEVLNSQVDLNLKSVFLMCHHVLPIMAQQSSGGVASVASIAGLRYIGKPHVGHAATKAAIIQLMKTTAVIYAPKGVRLNTVVSGLMDTPYTKYMRQMVKRKDTWRCVMRKFQWGKMGDASDVANATLFLVSDEAQYIAGQELIVDGGITSSTGRT